MVKSRVLSLYRVYFFRPANGRVAEAGETLAVSVAEAINNVRWNVFGRLSVETVLQKHGFRLIATRAGTTKDQELAKLATGSGCQQKTPGSRQAVKRGSQMCFVGQGFTISEPDRPRR